jgi:hypothetical protein
VEEIDPTSYQVREVYARYGLAMYQAQCVERQLAILLASEYRPGPSKITRSEYEQLLESHFERTLGGLLRQLEKSIPLPADFEGTLRKALEKRNWLAHRYFWERAGHFVSEKGRDKMLLELQEAIDYFEILDARLTDIADSWAKRHNIPPEELEKALERIIANAEKET